MKTTQKQFNEFKKSFLHWQQAFGLTQYRVTFDMDKLDNSYAEIRIDEMGKCCTVTLCSEYTGRHEIASFDPTGSGRHEALELLIHRLSWLGGCRYLEESDIREEAHAVIRRIEAVL